MSGQPSKLIWISIWGQKENEKAKMKVDLTKAEDFHLLPMTNLQIMWTLEQDPGNPPEKDLII